MEGKYYFYETLDYYYFGSMEYSDIDKAYHGKLTGISDIVTYEADTWEELFDAFREAAADYIFLCLNFEQTPKCSKVPEELKKEGLYIKLYPGSDNSSSSWQICYGNVALVYGVMESLEECQKQAECCMKIIRKNSAD